MTTPTQAQIEAALRRARVILANMAQENEGAIFNRWPINHEPLRNDAKNALPEIDAALTAAAQVGAFEAGPDECDTGVALTKAIDAVLAEDTPLVNHTIERCAQVADSFHAYDRPADEIAAAIRKLKETI